MKKTISILLILCALLQICMISAFADSWKCVYCGNKNEMNFCAQCGKSKNEAAGVWICGGCGNMCTQNFCPVCGRAKIATDTVPDSQKPEVILPAVGDYITFGKYEQDNNTSNGKENIEWLVLEVDSVNNRALVISRYALDSQKYNEERDDITWENCTLRTWLRDTFMKDAFSALEQAKIADIKLKADINPRYNTYTGNDTTDKVFILSAVEAEKYLKHSDQVCGCTIYCKARGATSSQYWLRSPGECSYKAVTSAGDGGFQLWGHEVNSEYAVRPALWINLAS